MNHEELVELLQEGKIGYLRFVLEGENGQEQTDIMQMERQLIDDEDYGIWN